MFSNRPLLWAAPLVSFAVAALFSVEARAQGKSETKPASRPGSETRPADMKKPLAVGDPAPDFKVKDQTGKVRSLADFKGKRVLLFFYPKADTPG
jgi:cytochrome oxidase Cu insertion factor (SCO1/SenC/PrrC family)